VRLTSFPDQTGDWFGALTAVTTRRDSNHYSFPRCIQPRWQGREEKAWGSLAPFTTCEALQQTKWNRRRSDLRSLEGKF